MIRRHRLRTLSGIFAVLALGACGSIPPMETQEIRFLFAPADGLSYTQTMKTTRTKRFRGEDKVVDESVITTRVSVTRTASGWDMHGEPLDTVLKRNGVVIDNALARQLSKVSFIYRLHPDGSLSEMTGFDEFVDGMTRQFPPEIMQQLAPVLDVQAMKARAGAEWNGRIGDFIGRKINIGDEEQNQVPFELPDGSNVTFRVHTVYAAMEPCGNTRCVRIEQHYDSQADEAARFSGQVANKIVRGVAPEAGISNPRKNKARILGRITRLIDPSTMLIYREESSRQLEMEIDIPGIGLVPGTMSETRVHEMQY